MKRIFIGTLSILALSIFGLTGCGEKTETTATSETTAASSEATTDEASESASSEAIADETSESASNEASSSSTDTASASALPELSEEVKAMLGTVQDGVYTNETLGFSLETPKDWSVLDPEAIQEMSGNVASLDSGITVIYSFPGEIATLGNGDSNVFMVSIQKTPAGDNLAESFQSQKESYDSMQEQFVASQSAETPMPSITKNEVKEFDKDNHKFYQSIVKMEMEEDGQKESQEITTTAVESDGYTIAVVASSANAENEALLKAAVDSFKFTK